MRNSGDRRWCPSDSVSRCSPAASRRVPRKGRSEDRQAVEDTGKELKKAGEKVGESLEEAGRRSRTRRSSAYELPIGRPGGR
jgi:hypothetical protein